MEVGKYMVSVLLNKTEDCPKVKNWKKTEFFIKEFLSENENENFQQPTRLVAVLGRP